MTFGALKLSLILFGLSWLLKFQAWRHPEFRARLKERDLTAQEIVLGFGMSVAIGIPLAVLVVYSRIFERVARRAASPARLAASAGASSAPARRRDG